MIMRVFMTIFAGIMCVLSGLTFIYGMMNTNETALTLFFLLATLVLFGLFIELVKICKRK